MIRDSIHTRYSKSIIALHWLMLILIVAVYATINLRELFPKGSDPRESMKALHFMLGLSVLLFVSIRIWARLSSSAPTIIPQLNTWQNITSKSVHAFLYFMMIAMPILGWLTLSAAGKVIPFFGLELPALIAANEGYEDTLKDIHETIGEIGYYVIALHAGAALFHHFIKGDNTLTRMLPDLKKD
jgi:superoxide oxidase